MSAKMYFITCTTKVAVLTIILLESPRIFVVDLV